VTTSFSSFSSAFFCATYILIDQYQMVITMMVLLKLFGCSENDIDDNGDHMIIGDDEGDNDDGDDDIDGNGDHSFGDNSNDGDNDNHRFTMLMIMVTCVNSILAQII
jgi:hypothetical protein